MHKLLLRYSYKSFGDSNRVTLTCNKENKVALALYKNLGFEETGVVDDNEIELSLNISTGRNSKNWFT